MKQLVMTVTAVGFFALAVAIIVGISVMPHPEYDVDQSWKGWSQVADVTSGSGAVVEVTPEPLPVVPPEVYGQRCAQNPEVERLEELGVEPSDDLRECGAAWSSLLGISDEGVQG